MVTILEELHRCKQQNIKGVLATIVNTVGSTYQKKGAKCFISEDGQYIGLLSGGCVEGDLKEHANQVIAEGKPRLIYYNFQGEGGDLWGLGLGCNGAMEIFIDPYVPGTQKADRIEAIFAQEIKDEQIVVTVIQSSDESLVGQRWLVTDTEQEQEWFPNQKMKNEIKKRKQRGIELKGLFEIEINSIHMQVFIDLVEPIPELVVFGAGPDAVPVVLGGKNLGWFVTVYDHREAYLNRKNFPLADRLVCIPRGEEPPVPLNKNSYVVIMSHHFQQDQYMLLHSLRSDTPYIGVLGPRRRTERLLGNIFSESKLIRNSPLQRIHSPIGLDIGSQTPEEIALSIVSEMVAVYRGGSGMFLHDRKGAIKETDIHPEKERVSLSI